MPLNYKTLSREVSESLEMLQWISERNAHVPIADLAFLLDIPESEYLHEGLANYSA
ncbi:MAG: hypothetical protein R8K49_01140 [Mariprofundaceae bacterium]